VNAAEQLCLSFNSELKFSLLIFLLVLPDGNSGKLCLILTIYNSKLLDSFFIKLTNGIRPIQEIFGHRSYCSSDWIEK